MRKWNLSFTCTFLAYTNDGGTTFLRPWNVLPIQFARLWQAQTAWLSERRVCQVLAKSLPRLRNQEDGKMKLKIRHRFLYGFALEVHGQRSLALL